jgi:hypothetical protein
MSKLDSNHTVIFTHIPKTAGTTLFHIIERHYKSKNVYAIWEDGPLEAFKGLSDARKAGIRLLRGHVGFGMHRYLPNPSSYLTILREPIERTLSYYSHICRVPSHYCHDIVVSNQMSLLDFLESKCDPMASNAQTRLLSGLETGQEVEFGKCSNETLEAAKANLRESFAVVGLAEEFDATLLLLKEAFGWHRLLYHQQNISIDRLGTENLTQATRNAILRCNGLDIKLYQYAKALFQEQIRQQGPAFARQVHQFRLLNQWLNPLIRVRWEAENQVKHLCRKLKSP